MFVKKLLMPLKIPNVFYKRYKQRFSDIYLTEKDKKKQN